MGTGITAKLATRICKYCGKSFLTCQNAAKYCSVECRKSAAKKSGKTPCGGKWNKELNEYQAKNVGKALWGVGENASKDANMISWQEAETFHGEHEICRWCGKGFKPFSIKNGQRTGKFFCCIQCASNFNSALRTEGSRRRKKHA